VVPDSSDPHTSESAMFIRLARTSSRQREIIEVVLRNGWDYARQLLVGRRTQEPQLPTPTILRNVLAELGPVFVKLGQLLSTRPDLLPAAYIDALSTLQANVPPVPWEQMETVVRQQLTQPLAEVFRNIEPKPLAAGSIGQVHRATLVTGEVVVLKIQRPGIGIVVDQDTALLRSLAEVVQRTEFGQTYDVVSLAQEFTNALKAELRFTKEASYTDRLRQNLAQSRWFEPDRLRVPKIYRSLTTDKLLVMEWLDGVPLLQAHEHTGLGSTNGSVPAFSGPETARMLLRAFFQQICLDGFFHADPHPGNLFYLRSGQVALLDCGMVGQLDPRTQAVLLELLLAIVNLDAQRCSQLTLDLSPSNEEVNLLRLENDYDRLLRRYYSLSLSDINFSKLFYDVLETARNNRVRIPANLGLCAKSLANLEGVGRSLDPEFNVIEEIKPLMTDVFQRQLVGDAPLTALLRTTLDVKNLSLRSPRQLEMLLDRITSETLQWNLSLKELEPVRRSLVASANRLAFSIVVASLIVGAAVISSQGAISQVSWLSDALFAAASLLGLWLLISIVRSGTLR